MGLFLAGTVDAIGEHAMNRVCTIAAVCMLVAGCGTEPIQNGAWVYDYDDGKLNCNGIEPPEACAKHGIWLATPLGTFQPYEDGKWFRQGHLIPLPDASETWVSHLISSEVCTEEMQETGYYATNQLQTGTSSWRNTQLQGTPPEWVYAHNRETGKDHGVWISPAKLSKFDWTSL